MRKQYQKQVLDLMQMIKQIQSAGLYADCQNAAATVSEFIDNFAGKGTKTAELLGEYCNLLLSMNSGDITADCLTEHLNKIENSVKSELRSNKIEIAFLSYKSSMSDCLESIYLAAKADPDCDAYWIPIPYFERNYDGSFGASHYEGAEHYDESFVCVNWFDYDIEARRPDIIFTFAPYDKDNFITSVHPNFYCERLKGLTDLLVYVPYFVVAKDVGQQFCPLPGCMFSNKVVVQSDKVRDTYIRIYEKAFGSMYGDPEDKFIVLGSPKYDKVINTGRESCKLPDDWRKLIGNKKVVLYNLSIGSMLAHGEQYCNQLSSVIDIFSENDDVVLWLRPHPLSDASYKSMRPHLFKKYEQVIESFKQSGQGIFDDSSDLHRAIAMSDAYYGDWSSVAVLYQATGKPIMIQNSNQTRNRDEFIPTILYVDESNIWFSLKCINALFKMERDTWIPQFVGSFPDEPSMFTRLETSMHIQAAANNGNIYFAPHLASKISKYSTEDKSFSKIAYKKHNDSEIYHRDFFGAISYKEYVYLTPCLYPGIARINTATNTLEYYSDWVEPVKKLIGDDKNSFFAYPLVVENTIWLASCNSNALVEFNMDTNTSTVYEVGKAAYRFSSVCFDGTNFWLSPVSGTSTPIVKWNPKSGIIKEFNEIYNDPGGNRYVPLVYSGGFLWLLPKWSKHAYKIDVSSDTISIAEEFELDVADLDSGVHLNKYSQSLTFKDSMFAYNELAGTLIEYNFSTKKRREEVINFSQATVDQIRLITKNVFLQNPELFKTEHDCYHYECCISGLKNFLEHLTSETGQKQENMLKPERQKFLQKSNVNADGTAGQAIYDWAKSSHFNN